jgi:hypothetical protein
MTPDNIVAETAEIAAVTSGYGTLWIIVGAAVLLCLLIPAARHKNNQDKGAGMAARVPHSNSCRSPLKGAGCLVITLSLTSPTARILPLLAPAGCCRAAALRRRGAVRAGEGVRRILPPAGGGTRSGVFRSRSSKGVLLAGSAPALSHRGRGRSAVQRAGAVPRRQRGGRQPGRHLYGPLQRQVD